MAMDSREILAHRRRFLGESLSLSYQEPLQMVRGKACELFDEHGRAYLDCVNNVCHVGHCHPKVVAAATAQMALLNTNTRYLHESRVKYAERLAATFPAPLEVCFFVCSGSEANDLALRMARAYTERKAVLVVDGAYHGTTTAVIELSPYKFNGRGGEGQASHVHVVDMPDVYRGRYRGHDQAGLEHARDVADLVKRVKPAAFFCESLLGCGGQVVLPEDYLPTVYESVREAGALCVADEVQVGFGRVGKHFWGFELYGVVPDIVTLGKPIGNGHPMAAVVTTKEIASAFANGMEYFNTFGGNPVSCATGMAVLDVIVEEQLQENALEVGEALKLSLRALMTESELIGEVRGEGLFLGIELVLDRESLEPAAKEASLIVERMKQRGVLLSVDGPLHNVIKIKPPIVFSRQQAAFLVAQLKAVLGSL